VSPGSVLSTLGEADLGSLAVAIRSERLAPPFGTSAVQRITGEPMAAHVASALTMLSVEGCTPGALATCLEAIADSVAARLSVEDQDSIGDDRSGRSSVPSRYSCGSPGFVSPG